MFVLKLNEKQMKNFTFGVFFIFTIMFSMLTGCSFEPNPAVQGNEVTTPYFITQINDHVWCVGSQDGNNYDMVVSRLYDKFIKEHPELKVVGVDGNGSRGYGTNTKLFIFVEQR
jgi:hypothetical protein